MGWQWHQPDYIWKSFACHSRQIIMPAPHQLFFTGSSWCPTNSVKALKAQNNKKNELKMFYQTYTTRKAAKITAKEATEWSHLLLCDITCSERIPFRRCRGWWEWKAFFVPGDLDLWPLILTFKLVSARDQMRLPREFGTNPFGGSGDIWGTNKKVTDGHKNRTLLTCSNNMSMNNIT